MTRRANGALIGAAGATLLLISYVRLFGFRFLSPAWSIAILVLSALAVVAFIVAGRLSSRWWYCGTLLGLLGVFLVFAFAWG